MISRIKTLHTVNLVLRLVDDFTGRVLNDPFFSFFLNRTRIAPIRKLEGFFVLTGVEDVENAEIKICSPHYCHYTINRLSSMDENKTPITIRLKPGINYPIRNGTTAYSACFRHLNGSFATGIEVELHAPFREGTVKLKSIQKSEESAYISLTNPYGLDYTGLTLAAPSKNKSDPPFVFRLASRVDNTTFKIDGKSSEASSESAAVKRVYRSTADASGRVLIPFDPGSGAESSNETEVELYAFEGANSYLRNICLSKGVISYFDETLKW